MKTDQIHSGAIYAMRLSPDLTKPLAHPILLFNASEAPWVKKPDWSQSGSKHHFPTYITDDPFLLKLSGGSLILLWSSFGTDGYALGIARSNSQSTTGSWNQGLRPLWAKDGGHGMIFRSFDNRLLLTFHAPNTSPNERPLFIELEETSNEIRIKK